MAKAGNVSIVQCCREVVTEVRFSLALIDRSIDHSSCERLYPACIKAKLTDLRMTKLPWETPRQLSSTTIKL